MCAEKSPKFRNICKIFTHAKISCFTVDMSEIMNFYSLKWGENLPALPWETINLIVTALSWYPTFLGSLEVFGMIFRLFIFQWWRDLFRCRIDLFNFSVGCNIIAPYMEFLHLNWYIVGWFPSAFQVQCMSLQVITLMPSFSRVQYCWVQLQYCQVWLMPRNGRIEGLQIQWRRLAALQENNINYNTNYTLRRDSSVHCPCNAIYCRVPASWVGSPTNHPGLQAATRQGVRDPLASQPPIIQTSKL